MKDELIIGRVRSAFGTVGEIKVESLSGETAHFTALRVVDLRRGFGSEIFRVESVRTTHRAILMKLEGVDTPEGAAALRGAEIVVRRTDAAPLEPGEYYYGDLEGLIVTFNGEAIGRIKAVLESGAHPLLEVTLVDGGSVLIPFADQFFGEVDHAAGRIQLMDGAVLE
ncbi:MAG: ribosome maturation factor RimM [Spirochaetales bacterium]|nr:ribosome maturation factor RimM [Spirochaetales bacterium]